MERHKSIVDIQVLGPTSEMRKKPEEKEVLLITERRRDLSDRGRCDE